MIISMPNNWESVEKKHNKFLQGKIDTFLKKNRPEPVSLLTRPFVKCVRQHLSSSSRDELETSIRKLLYIERNIPADEYQQLITDLKSVFNYDAFSDKKKTGWNAYDLCRGSKLRTCPYCNSAYAITVYRDKKNVLRPTLDHFYPQSVYPHLALTLANLIPSCNACNSSMKGDLDFYLVPHLHPYFDKESISFSCVHPSKTIVDIIGNFSSIKEELSFKLQPPQGCIASRNSLDSFELELRYDFLNREGIEFITSQLEIEALLGNQLQSKHHDQETVTSLDLEDSDLKARLLRFKRDDYKEYPLGRMYADLQDQFYRGFQEL